VRSDPPAAITAPEPTTIARLRRAQHGTSRAHLFGTGGGSTGDAMMRSRDGAAPRAPRGAGREWTMKKHTNVKLKLRLGHQTIRQLIESDHRAVVGGSSVVYTCTTVGTGAQTGQPTVGCQA
jgi:hypothetical protein